MREKMLPDRLTLNLPAGWVARLRRVARPQGRNVSQYAREAIRSALARDERAAK